jgi:hypothetical protein
MLQWQADAERGRKLSLYGVTIVTHFPQIEIIK